MILDKIIGMWLPIILPINRPITLPINRQDNRQTTCRSCRLLEKTADTPIADADPINRLMSTQNPKESALF